MAPIVLFILPVVVNEAMFMKISMSLTRLWSECVGTRYLNLVMNVSVLDTIRPVLHRILLDPHFSRRICFISK